jgi:hypothetical protein
MAVLHFLHAMNRHEILPALIVFLMTVTTRILLAVAPIFHSESMFAPEVYSPPKMICFFESVGVLRICCHTVQHSPKQNTFTAITEQKMLTSVTLCTRTPYFPKGLLDFQQALTLFCIVYTEQNAIPQTDVRNK